MIIRCSYIVLKEISFVYFIAFDNKKLSKKRLLFRFPILLNRPQTHQKVRPSSYFLDKIILVVFVAEDEDDDDDVVEVGIAIV